MDKKLNAVEFAIKVTSFRKMVRQICAKNGLEYPSDEKIAEWIEQGYGMENIDDFIKDYTEKEGIFRDPIRDFAKKVWEYAWSEKNKPTMEEMSAWVAKNGYDINGFLRQRTIASYSPLERKTLIDTLKLGDALLVALWNQFIEESAKYGADSYIYDLRNEADVNFITANFPRDIKAEITRLNNDFNLHGKTLRFLQWHNLNDGKVYAKEDIKGIIVAYWSDIFERVMGFPYCYRNIMAEQGGTDYFFDTFWPSVREFLGYKFDERDGSITEIAKK